MADMHEARLVWKKLMEELQPLEEEARTKQSLVTAKFSDCQQGRGAGPTEDEIWQADRAVRAARLKRQECDDFIERLFG